MFLTIYQLQYYSLRIPTILPLLRDYAWYNILVQYFIQDIMVP